MMDTEDKKIIPFPGTEKEPTEKKKQWKIRILTILGDHPFFTILTAIILPVFLAVMGPFLGKNIGKTELTESYIMPYTYAQGVYMANAPAAGSGEIMYPTQSSIISAESYQRACALRSFFTCSKTAMSQVTDSTLNLYSLEEYRYFDMEYFAFAKENEVRVYAVNSGDGKSDPVEAELSAELVLGTDMTQREMFPWGKMDAEAGEALQEKKTLPVSCGSLSGGDAKMIYSFTLSEWSMRELQEGKSIALYLNGESGERLLGWIKIYNGKVIVDSGGGAGAAEKYTYYVYVDVEAGGGREIPVNAVFNIQDHAAADTVIIPSKSCKMEYSMAYEVEGKKLETKRFTTIIKVPRYETMGGYEVAFQMNKLDLDFYACGTDKELHERVKFDPTSLMAEE